MSTPRSDGFTVSIFFFLAFCKGRTKNRKINSPNVLSYGQAKKDKSAQNNCRKPTHTSCRQYCGLKIN
ncbi:hypothetical protein XELAEV_18003527mg [Xenopus laevis]|uniref:Uncharacterized protein n=1 Tax=Xenopus laevis TaxID=8355 RepID=A0A974BNF7_XENLA|nr:hypothetical protein XELAEV_18003527mg [Xenopus laevis]